MDLQGLRFVFSVVFIKIGYFDLRGVFLYVNFVECYVKKDLMDLIDIVIGVIYWFIVFFGVFCVWFECYR